jgi:hypothetical protein
MFLVGGPAFSGTTLLAHLLNQGDLVCLDEPDFHNPEQSHRGIPLLRSLFPDRSFPDPPDRPLDPEETFAFIELCDQALRDKRLGVKTCDTVFLDLVPIYRRAGCPVIAIVRDVRDALVRELPDWVDEGSLVRNYRKVWSELDSFDVWLRYEDLVADPDGALARISPVLSTTLRAQPEWDPGSVSPAMFKLDRHEPLANGRIAADRVGIWRTADRAFTSEAHATAGLMGYGQE